MEFLQPVKRSTDAPIYAIDLNVFFDVVQERERSDDAGALFEAALRHQIRLVVSQEFILELQRASHNPNNDPILSLAKRIPSLPPQARSTIDKLAPIIAISIFPNSESKKLRPNDESDVFHVAHAVAAGTSGYITSDFKILSARDSLMENFNLDVIGLSEFVELLDLPDGSPVGQTVEQTNNFRLQIPTAEESVAFLSAAHIAADPFLAVARAPSPEQLSVSDHDGMVGVSILAPAPGLDQPSRSMVCVRQEHPFSSTIADFLISELVRCCSRNGPGCLQMMDIPSHPITRRIALGQGFQQPRGNPSILTKIALGLPVTEQSWNKARLSIERLGGPKLQRHCPTYKMAKAAMTAPNGQNFEVGLFDLETLVSPAIFALPGRDAVIVPITRAFAADLLGTDLQCSFLEVPEAQFLVRRTYFNTTRAVRAMTRGAAIAFYESSRGNGRGAIVALGRIVDVTSIPVDRVPEALQRGAVVDKPENITKSKRVLATTFDNLIALERPVTLKMLRQLGCDTKSNFVSATAISAPQLSAIVNAGCTDG